MSLTKEIAELKQVYIEVTGGVDYGISPSIMFYKKIHKKVASSVGRSINQILTEIRKVLNQEESSMIEAIMEVKELEKVAKEDHKEVRGIEALKEKITGTKTYFRKIQ